MSNEKQKVEVKQAVLSKNAELAANNRNLFAEHGLLVLNLLSSPGSGKTMLLERTLAELGKRIPMGVIVGDLETENDALRLRRYSSAVQSIRTGGRCHLEAQMIAEMAQHLPLAELKLIFIENVGNLICPASFDLGEKGRVVLFSVTEGEDKPLKYPVIFRRVELVIVSKIDLAGAVEFNREEALSNIRKVAPEAQILEVSAKSGRGLDAWYNWLEQKVAK